MPVLLLLALYTTAYIIDKKIIHFHGYFGINFVDGYLKTAWYLHPGKWYWTSLWVQYQSFRMQISCRICSSQQTNICFIITCIKYNSIHNRQLNYIFLWILWHHFVDCYLNTVCFYRCHNNNMLPTITLNRSIPRFLPVILRYYMFISQ